MFMQIIFLITDKVTNVSFHGAWSALLMGDKTLQHSMYVILTCLGKYDLEQVHRNNSKSELNKKIQCQK